MDRGIMAWFGNIEGWLGGIVERYAHVDDRGRVVDFRKI